MPTDLALSTTCPFCGHSHGKLVHQLFARKSLPNRTTKMIYLRCLGCGIVFLQNREAFPSQQEYYERLYQDKEGLIRNLDYRNGQLLDDTKALFQRVILPRQVRSILDFGCGDAVFLSSLQRMNPALDLTGFDIESKAVESNRQRFPKIKFSDSLERLNSNNYDLVTLNDVIEHLECKTLEQTLCLIQTVLRPGGYLYVKTPNYACLNRKLFGDLWPQFITSHYTLFDPHTLDSLVGRAGFQRVASFRTPMRLHRVVSLCSFNPKTLRYFIGEVEKYLLTFVSDDFLNVLYQVND